MEALTKIEIGFAVLRDKLYVERMEEVSKEGEMIYKGTHPDLIHLTNLIELRRERRLKLVELWFEEQQKQYARVASSEEAAAWSHWRVSFHFIACATRSADFVFDLSTARCSGIEKATIE